MLTAAALVLCYILGSIPFGLIIGKLAKGIDIRDFGSGNIGASNVLRTLGPGPAAAVFLFDTAKGTAAVLLCKALGLPAYLVVAGGLLSLIGHTASVFLRFKGGKGVATSLGIIIGLNGIIAAIAFGIWLVTVSVTRFISVASIVASLSVPLMMLLWKDPRVPIPYQVLAWVAAAAIAARHQSNIKRLLAGTEPRIFQKTKGESR